MQDPVSIFIRAVLEALLATRVGSHLAIAALIAFCAGVVVAMLTKDVVPARWASAGASLMYLAFASVYAAVQKKGAYDAPGPRETSTVARIVLSFVGSAATLLLFIIAVRTMQGGLEWLGLTDGPAFWLSFAAYSAAIVALLVWLRRSEGAGQKPGENLKPPGYRCREANAYDWKAGRRFSYLGHSADERPPYLIDQSRR